MLPGTAKEKIVSKDSPMWLPSPWPITVQVPHPLGARIIKLKAKIYTPVPKQQL